jgi:hypothetical protein
MLTSTAARSAAALCLVAACTPALAEGDSSASPLAFVRADASDAGASAPGRGNAGAYAASADRDAAMRGSGRSGGGIAKQTPSVAIGCLKPGLVGILRRASTHFGDEIVVTSGFRGGRGRSYHAKCMAADVQIAGVRPSTLARWFRAQPDVGGVGTYGHTSSVHVDIAPRKFSWHGRSSRRIRTADACPCCGGQAHGSAAKFACERGISTPEIKLGRARA